jgi:GTP-binding protein HflX
MSARRHQDVAVLHQAIVAFFRQHLVEAELFVPWSAQKLRNKIFSSFEVMEERADAGGAFLRVRGEREAVSGLSKELGRAR